MKRGIESSPHHTFSKYNYEIVEEWQTEEMLLPKTNLIEVHPKTIVNEVKSPDINFRWSLNPYQGCEHGCSYCYARYTHENWGYNAGVDFESQILVKRNAPELLRKLLKKDHWKGEPISLSGNTDCYQPAERSVGITRELLKVFLEFKHPVTIITKNALILRDLDILEELAKYNLVQVAISITTLDKTLQSALEPRASIPDKRLRVVELLSSKGIPTMVMIAPVIPGINSNEVLPIMEQASLHGAKNCGYILVRLNGMLGELFEGWLKLNKPDKAKKVLKLIRDCHQGSLEDFDFKSRMKGSGAFAEQIRSTFLIGKKKYFKEIKMPELNRALYKGIKNPQLNLFD